MPQVAQIALKAAALHAYGLPVPEDVARFNGGQPAQHAQQAGLAYAIGSCHMQPAPCRNCAMDALEQLPPPLAATEVSKGKNRT